MAKKKPKSKAKPKTKSNPEAKVTGQLDDFWGSLEREIAAKKQEMFSKFLESPEEFLKEPPHDMTDPVSYFGPGYEHEETEEEINSASDRNAAILAASRLEWRVKQVVKARLCVAENGRHAVRDRHKEGRLGFFRAMQASILPRSCWPSWPERLSEDRHHPK